MIINYLSNNNNIVHKITNFDYVELHNGQHHYIITHLVTMYLRMLLYYSGERNALPHFFISRYTVVITNSLTNMSMPYHIKLFIRSQTLASCRLETSPYVRKNLVYVLRSLVDQVQMSTGTLLKKQNNDTYLNPNYHQFLLQKQSSSDKSSTGMGFR